MLNDEFLIKCASKGIIAHKTKVSNLFQKSTHLYLNGKRIETIGNLTKFCNLKVLYLHNNLLRGIDCFDSLVNLTHLYLQWNKISKISNLNFLKNLKKLYLGFNEIKRLENIEQLTRLEELHIEGQRVDEEFLFDFDCLRAISPSLTFLNISKLNLTKIQDLRCLVCLEVLIAYDNKFNDVEDIGRVLECMVYLRRVDLYGCPAQKDTHYREKITAWANKIEYLDGKFITSNNRTFIKKFEQIRLERIMTKKSHHSRLKSRSEPLSSKYQQLSVHLQTNDSDGLSYRPWNSLHSIQRPRRLIKNQAVPLRPKTDYQLQGKNIAN